MRFLFSLEADSNKKGKEGFTGKVDGPGLSLNRPYIPSVLRIPSEEE